MPLWRVARTEDNFARWLSPVAVPDDLDIGEEPPRRRFSDHAPPFGQSMTTLEDLLLAQENFTPPGSINYDRAAASGPPVIQQQRLQRQI